MPATPAVSANADSTRLSAKDYHDRLLGSLVGSAIGDAMGAPVEMWDRHAIDDRYGLVDRLIPNVRNASPEGTWQTNMRAGTSTDDTRWKWLCAQFFIQYKTSDGPVDDAFARFIIRSYDQMKDDLLAVDGLAAGALEESTRYLQWLQEWVKVSEAWLSGDLRTFTRASAKFYGGEMACAGMLYAPMIGACYPARSATAYQLGWEMSLFDLGYAKDITAMTAALTAAAFQPELTMSELLQIHYELDGEGYADSRLIGRIINGIYENSLADQRAVKKKIESNDFNESVSIPEYFKNRPEKYQEMKLLFDQMDRRLQDIPFHANEIYMITLNSLLFAEGNFMDAMVFVTNYGRDNDTAGAVVGAILGAQLGFEKLPKNIREQALEANLRDLDIDLELLADQLSDRYQQLID